MNSPLRLLSLLVLGAAGTGFAQVNLDFETAGQLSANFRNLGTGTSSLTQSSNGAANDFVSVNNTNATQFSFGALGLLYDTTPADTTAGTQSAFTTTSPLTVSVDFRAAVASTSIGVYFADANNTSNNVLALFNVDTSGNNDQLRFFRDGVVTSAGTQVGSSSNVSTGVNVGSPFSNLSATLSVVGTTPSISFTVGTQTVTSAFLAGHIDWSSTVVILRLFDNDSAAGTSLDIDNFSVSSIPEPGTCALFFGGAALAMFALRRRKRA